MPHPLEVDLHHAVSSAAMRLGAAVDTPITLDAWNEPGVYRSNAPLRCAAVLRRAPSGIAEDLTRVIHLPDWAARCVPEGETLRFEVRPDEFVRRVARHPLVWPRADGQRVLIRHTGFGPDSLDLSQLPALVKGDVLARCWAARGAAVHVQGEAMSAGGSGSAEGRAFGAQVHADLMWLDRLGVQYDSIVNLDDVERSDAMIGAWRRFRASDAFRGSVDEPGARAWLNVPSTLSGERLRIGLRERNGRPSAIALHVALCLAWSGRASEVPARHVTHRPVAVDGAAPRSSLVFDSVVEVLTERPQDPILLTQEALNAIGEADVARRVAVSWAPRLRMGGTVIATRHGETARGQLRAFVLSSVDAAQAVRFALVGDTPATTFGASVVDLQLHELELPSGPTLGWVRDVVGGLLALKASRTSAEEVDVTAVRVAQVLLRGWERVDVATREHAPEHVKAHFLDVTRAAQVWLETRGDHRVTMSEGLLATRTLDELDVLLGWLAPSMSRV